MINKKSLILSLSIVFCFCVTMTAFAGTTGKIAGKITDKESGEPLPGVNVIIEGSMMGAATDIEGDYFILNIPPGVYNVKASMMGYETVTKTDVKVQTDRTVKVNFALRSATAASILSVPIPQCSSPRRFAGTSSAACSASRGGFISSLVP